jgi:hypothetical protein
MVVIEMFLWSGRYDSVMTVVLIPVLIGDELNVHPPCEINWLQEEISRR